MPHLFRRGVWTLIGLLSLVLANTTFAVPPSGETLFPSTTRGFVSVPNVVTFAEHWQQTDLARLLNDPQMQPFSDDLRRQLNEKWLKSHERLGLEWSDLEQVVSGELCLGLVHESDTRPAVVLTADVTEHMQQASELLEKIKRNMLAKGATRTEKTTPSDVTIVVYDVPPRGARKETWQGVYFLDSGLLVAADNLAAAIGVEARLKGTMNGSPTGAPLKTNATYQSVFERCRANSGELVPHLVWFTSPVELIESIRAAGIVRPKANGTDYLKVLKNQGFGAIQGVGGFLNMAEGRYGVLHRTAVIAPPPFTLGMRMLSFPTSDNFVPEPWVPADVAGYTTLYWEVKAAFDCFSTVWDEIIGEQGNFEDLLEDIKKDPNGPFNVREELIAHLGTRVTIFADYKLPITTTSERRIVAVETTNPAAMIASLQKAMQNDPKITRKEIGEHVVWVIRAGEETEYEFEFEDPESEDAQPEEEPDADTAQGQDGDVNLLADADAKLPNAAVTVAFGYLLVASDEEMLTKVLEARGPALTLAQDDDFRAVFAELDRVVNSRVCMSGFSRTDAQYRAAYELFRQNKLPEADTLLANLLNAVFQEEQEGVIRKPQFDGSKLPEFDNVRRFLGNSGTRIQNEDNGWFITGFSLAKETPLAEEAGELGRNVR